MCWARAYPPSIRASRIEIYSAVVLEGAGWKSGIMAAAAQLFANSKGGHAERLARFSKSTPNAMLWLQIGIGCAKLEQLLQRFVRQLPDVVEIGILGAAERFAFVRRVTYCMD